MNPSLEDILDIRLARKAWERVRRNRGGPGIDGLTVREVEATFPELWAAVADNIRRDRFEPLPVRRVAIPKNDGGERLLGIPAVMDRILAQALHQSLFPLWEEDFSPMSFAYRPGRTPIQAVRAARAHLTEGLPWCLHLDIQNFFDSVPHALVLNLLSRRLYDTRVVRLVQRLLKSGVCHEAIVTKSERGLHQGSPLSPLLANIALHQLDQWLHDQSISFVRYADDLLLCTSDKETANHLKPKIKTQLSNLGLKINEGKTVSAPADKSAFLGFTFARNPDESALGYQILISEKSMTQLTATLDALLESNSFRGPQECTRECGQLLRSWLEYYGNTDDERQVRQIHEHAVAGLTTHFPESLAPGPERIATLQEWGLSPHHPRSGKSPLGYGGALPPIVDGWATFTTLMRRLPRQRAVRLRLNFGPGRGSFLTTRSLSLIVFGQEIRISL